MRFGAIGRELDRRFELLDGGSERRLAERVGRPPHPVAVCLIGREHIARRRRPKRRDRLRVLAASDQREAVRVRGRREERLDAGFFFDDPEAHEMSGDGHGPLAGAAFLIGDHEPEGRSRLVWSAGACQLAGEQVRTHDVGGIERRCFLKRGDGRRGIGRGRMVLPARPSSVYASARCGSSVVAAVNSRSASATRLRSR